MLGSILKILLFFMVLRMLYPVFQGIGSLFSSKTPVERGTKPKDAKKDYSELTPYEIEEADFEDISDK